MPDRIVAHLVTAAVLDPGFQVFALAPNNAFNESGPAEP
jgi:hypothetical protein